MELRQLRVFVTVAEEGHFGRAAARLHVVQPAVSQQIQRLERDLDVTLFDRTARGSRLTAAGQALLAQAHQLLAEEARTRRTVRRAARGEIGQVRIGCVPSALSGVLPQVVRALRRAHPEVGVYVRELHTMRQFDALLDGLIDIAFVRATQPAKDVTVTPVLTEPLLAAVPADHALAQRGRIPLGALAAEPFVLFARAEAPEYFDQVVRACHTAGFTPDVTHEVGSDHAQLGLVASGLGVALVPASTADLRLSGVSYVPLAGVAARTVMAVAHVPDRSFVLREEMLGIIADVFSPGAAAGPGPAADPGPAG